MIMNIKISRFAPGQTATRIALVALGVAAAMPALAQDVKPVGQACKSEIASLCADAKAEGGGVRKCLNGNAGKLGPECTASIAAAKERREKMRAACKDDIDKLCKDAEGKGGALGQCLRGKLAELSKPCADALAAMPAPAAK
jgi:hypothetical protein